MLNFQKLRGTFHIFKKLCYLGKGLGRKITYSRLFLRAEEPRIDNSEGPSGKNDPTQAAKTSQPRPKAFSSSRAANSVTPIIAIRPESRPPALVPITKDPQLPRTQPIAPVQSKTTPARPQTFPPIPPTPGYELQSLLSNIAQESSETKLSNPLSDPIPQGFVVGKLVPQPKKLPKQNLSWLESDRSFIPEFNPNLDWSITKHIDCNDDLNLGSFEQSKKVWAGTQKKGVNPDIQDATDYLGHIFKAVKADFPLTQPIAIPSEIKESLEWISTTPKEEVLKFWEGQFARLTRLFEQSASTQAKWDEAIPNELRGGACRIATVPLLALMRHFSLGGDRWVTQLVHGFPTCGIISQEGVFPTTQKSKPPIPLSILWKSSKKRFQERAKNSGFKNAEPLWSEALTQVKEGWLSEPIPISPSGDVVGFSVGEVNIAFRFGVDQNEKLRACDDLRHNMVNLATTILTPITLPTWDHISQLTKDVHFTQKKWSFLKADHADAYKQLPLDPGYANLTLVALRNPRSGKWFAFIPKVLLFGAVSAVIHYNCYSRLLAVLMNLALRIPVLNYFDDFGGLVPFELGPEALDSVEKFSGFFGSPMKRIKSEVKNEIKFLGLLGSFPDPDGDMLLRITLPQDKIERWSKITLDHATSGRASHKDLEKLIGKLSYTQTSVFGRFGRTLLKPLHDKLKERPYSEQLSDRERDILLWWVQSLRETIPRTISIKPTNPEFVIYTDAATSTKVLAALLLKVEDFDFDPCFEELRVETSEEEWETTFRDTTYIYGLEMIAIVATVLVLGEKLRGKNVTFYIDNSNCRDALVRGQTDTKVIDNLVKLFWAHVQRLEIYCWFEVIPSGLNPADAPTRDASLPLRVKESRSFGILKALRIWLDSEMKG